MIVLLLVLFITGLAILFLIQPDTKFSNVILFPFLLGIGCHSILFLLFAFLQIYYGKVLFLITSFIILLFSVCYTFYKHRKIKIENDLKKIPVYYLLFLIFILGRFIFISHSTFVNFNNWDELRVYQYICKKIFVTHNVNYIYELFAPMTYFLGTITYEFSGVTLNNPRIFGGIFYAIMSLFVYSRLNEFKVNRHISALLSMLFLISSAEIFLYYITFYNNVYYAVFFLVGVYLLLKNFFYTENTSNKVLAYLFLMITCLTRREAVFHVLGILVLVSGYLILNKKQNIKQMVFSILPFVGIFFSWSIFSHFNKISVSLKNYSVVQSFSEKIIERLNFKDIISFGVSSFKSMFSPSFFSSNYLIFGISFLLTILFIVKVFRKENNKSIMLFTSFTLFSQFIYFGIVFLTALLLFSKSEYLTAASFSRYMLMVAPISFISFGALLFENTQLEEEIKVKKCNTKKLSDYKVLFIIPAYNEEKNIKRTVESIWEYNQKHMVNYDVIVINDGSKDKTKTVLEENHISHINLVTNLGIGGAVQTGYKYAKENNYDIAIQFDGDGQHDIEYAKELILPIVDGKADMVIGSRFIDNNKKNFRSTWIRRIGITLISFMIKLTTKQKIYDATSGYRACNKEIIEIFSNNYPVEYPEPITEVRLLKNGYSIYETYAKMHERVAGKSSISRKLWVPAYYMFNVILSILIEGMVNLYDK